MTETFELRVNEKFADRLFHSEEGKKLGSGIVRLVKLNGDDPRLPMIGGFQKNLHRKLNRSFFFGWEIVRKYSRRELEKASLFHLKITTTFEPAGEERGTKYEESTACPRCGSGARQATPLFLPEKRIPKNKDICETIGGEILVSRRVKELFARHKISGANLSPIHPNKASSAELTDWFQLAVPNASAEICAPTRVGIDPFDDDENGECRCPLGDLLGLNLLSEVTIKSTSRGGADIFCTRQFIGVRRGLLRPERVILVSPKIWQLIESERIRGVSVEVANLA